MSSVAPARHTPAEVERLDPYVFIAVIAKRVIHPGGRHSTQELFDVLPSPATRRPDSHTWAEKEDHATASFCG